MREVDVMLAGTGYNEFDGCTTLIGDRRERLIVQKTAAFDGGLSSGEGEKIEFARYTL